jgi:RNA polymerase sigma factor (sigma-70 family)
MKKRKLTPLQKKRNELVLANMGLATHFANHFQASRMEYKDLVQEAYLGLIDAAELYDPARGTKFSTYARWHILKIIMDAIHTRNEIVRTPRRRPSLICGSLETAYDLADSAPDVSEVLDEAEMVDAVRDGIKLLPSREAMVIRMRRGVNTLPMTLRQVGDILAVTPERVRQIQNSGEEKLRAILAESAILRDHGAERPGA